MRHTAEANPVLFFSFLGPILGFLFLETKIWVILSFFESTSWNCADEHINRS